MSHPAMQTAVRPVGITSFWPVVLVNAVLGLPAYFISFLFAYGFRDEVGVTEHVTFLVLVAVFASVTGLIGAAIPPGEPGRPFASRIVPCVLMSLALNAAVVAAGSIVSALHKEENSVSAGFTTATDVLIALSLFVLAAVLGAVAVIAQRNDRS